MSIPSYDSSNIRTLSTLEDFRINAAQYIGSGGIDTDCQMAKEVLDNAFDESIDPNKIYHVKVVVFKKGDRYQFCVIDHGRGIPCDKMEDVYTKRSTSGKYDTLAYHGLTTGTWGVGSKLVVALSDRFLAISKRSDGFAGIQFAKGVKQDYKVLKPLDSDSSTDGTVVLYETDRTIVKQSNLYMFVPEGFVETLRLLDYTSATRPNTKITAIVVEDTLLDESFFKKSYAEQWGYLQAVKGTLAYQSPENTSMFEYARKQFNITEPTVWKIFAEKKVNLEDDSDKLGYEICVGLTKDPASQNGLFSDVNGNPITNPKSSQLAVLQACLKKQVVMFLDDDNPELKAFFENQYSIPLHGYVKILYKNAKFISQTKTSFENVDFARMYGHLLTKTFADMQPKVWEEMFDRIVDDLTDKFQAAMSKEFQTGKSLKNAAFKISRIGSYIPCAIDNPKITELLITEGMSAGDSVKKIRDENFQSILKLTGKPINTMKHRNEKLRNNRVYMDLMRLCGVGPKDTDLSGFNFKSIGLLADADPDGYHIVCLLIACLYKINPLILSSGRVWIANPPLYVHQSKSGRTLYLRDQHALNDTRVQIYDTYFRIELKDEKTGKILELKNDAYRDFVYLVKRVASVIRDVANKLAVDPFILEELTHVVDKLSLSTLDCDYIKKVFDLERCEYEPMANVLLMVSDGQEIPVPLDHLVHEIRAYILPEVRAIHWGRITPLITTKCSSCYNHEPLTFMQVDKIMSEIDSVFNIRRLKGLGECEEAQLKYSCVDPATRTYTVIRDLGDVDRIYRLLGVDPQWRKELAKTRLIESLED